MVEWHSNRKRGRGVRSRSQAKQEVGEAQEKVDPPPVGASTSAAEGGEIAPTPPPQEVHVAPLLGFDFPSNPMLRYEYPAPDETCLFNIRACLLTVPAFYTQVLHLMNKMNLPCPFGTNKFPLPKEGHGTSGNSSASIAASTSTHTNNKEQAHKSAMQRRRLASDLASDESELEDSEDDAVPEELRVMAANAGVKRPKLVHRDPAENKPALAPRISISLGSRAPLTTVSHPGAGGVDTPAPPKQGEQQEVVMELDKPLPLFEDEFILANKIPEAEAASHKAFKNYRAGDPSDTLYVKNLSKRTTEGELMALFSRFYSTSLEAQRHLSIRLMKTGRLRGQAFVTFSSPLASQEDAIRRTTQALTMVHRFLLHDKPMVLSYGRGK